MQMKVKTLLRCYLPGFLLLFILLFIYILISPRSPLPYPTPKSQTELSQIKINQGQNTTSKIVIPMIIHQMWKGTKETLPHELQRWSDGCAVVNKDIVLKLYTDADLSAFVHSTYPQYKNLFSTLKGVYMADMARVLIIYHFGGIYMDLDFYCHRPFHCLINSLQSTYLSSKPNADNLLVVSAEPVVHATIFRSKQRVIIQDFFMCTPKHPFLKWLLDDRQDEYHKQLELRQLDPSVKFTKGPFSYSIDKDIDRYHAYIRSLRSGQSTDTPKDSESNARKLAEKIPAHMRQEKSNKHLHVGHILELPESVLHPLIDQTNSRLYSVCGSRDIPPAAAASCEKVNNKQFFNPTANTVAVHMWTHIYLTFNMLRTMYSRNIYDGVERALPPTFSCF